MVWVLVNTSCSKTYGSIKWFCSDIEIKICDLVYFNKKDGSLAKRYQYEMIHEVEPNKDRLIHIILIKYRKHNENADRFSIRMVREVILIHPTDDLHLIEELGNAASTCVTVWNVKNIQHRQLWYLLLGFFGGVKWKNSLFWDEKELLH